MKRLRCALKSRFGFTMIELMIVVVIVGVMAAIAVSVYSRYVKNARVSEATGHMADILTAAKSYAAQNADETPGADWPNSCSPSSTSGVFLGECSQTANFAYALVGADEGSLTITATGHDKMEGVTVVMTVNDLSSNGVITVAGL